MYSPEERARIVDYVCEELANGRALTKILAEDGEKQALCSIAVFIRWQRNDEDIRSQVERARELGVESIVDEIIEIADNANADAYIEIDKDGRSFAKIDGEAIQRSKLRVYAREKYAQMVAPRRYGAKLDVTSAGEKLEAPKTAVLVDNRVQSLLAVALDRKAKTPSIEDLMGED
jgi:hypothetical protein